MVRSLGFFLLHIEADRIEVVVNLEMPTSIGKKKKKPTKSSPAKGPAKGQPNKR